MTRLKKMVLLGTTILTLTAASATVFAASPAATPGAVDSTSLEELKEQRLELRKDILEERVDAGLLTQEQADEILSQIEERQALCDGTGAYGQGRGMGAGFGGGYGQGGCRGFSGGYGQGGCGLYNQN